MIDCTFEGGHKPTKGLRHVTVGAIALNKEKQILLVRRAKNMHNGGKLAIPGGFLDRDEDTKTATLRELKEETGFDGEIVCLFRINDSPARPKEDRQNVDFIYVVNITGGKPTLNPEVTEILWFDKNSLPAEEVFAFDHKESIQKYFEYLEKPFPLPIVG